MTLTMTFEDHLKEQDRHIHHLSVRESRRFRRSMIGRSHRGLAALRRRRASWVDRKIEKYEDRAAQQPDSAPFFVFTDGLEEIEDDFVEVTNTMPVEHLQRDIVVAVEPHFGSHLLCALLGANPRLIIAHSKDVHLTLVDLFDELLDFEEPEVIDPEELAEPGFHYVTV